MSSLLAFQRVKYKDQEWHKFLLAIGEKPYLYLQRKRKERCLRKIDSKSEGYCTLKIP